MVNISSLQANVNKIFHVSIILVITDKKHHTNMHIFTIVLLGIDKLAMGMFYCS